jgi:hypothetical protein
VRPARGGEGGGPVHRVPRLDDQPGVTGKNGLPQAAGALGDDGNPAGGGLEGHETERLGVRGHEYDLRAAEQPSEVDTRSWSDEAHPVGDAVPGSQAHELVDVPVVIGRGVARDDEFGAQVVGHRGDGLDREVESLERLQPAGDDRVTGFVGAGVRGALAPGGGVEQGAVYPGMDHGDALRRPAEPGDHGVGLGGTDRHDGIGFTGQPGLAGHPPGGFRAFAGRQRGGIVGCDGVKALHVRHPQSAGEGQHGHAGEPVVRVDDVPRCQGGSPVSELVHEVLVVALRHRGEGACIQVPQGHAGGEPGSGGQLSGGTPGEDLDVMSQCGQRLRLVADDDVHAAGVTRTGLGPG